MLAFLHIRNFVTIEVLEIDFASGMTCLTGETGAGKSILIDALGLILGDKADPKLIRVGEKQAEISAQFNLHNTDIARWLVAHELPQDSEGLTLRRVLTQNGRSKAFINGSMVTLALLDELGKRLIEIHGQHAHQSLGKNFYQRELLDDYANHKTLCQQVELAYRTWNEMRERLAQLDQDQHKRQEHLELLRFQQQELDALAPLPGEWDELEQRQRRLANTHTLIETSERIISLLFNEETGVETLLKHALYEFETLSQLDNTLKDSLELTRSMLIEIQEISNVFNGYAECIEHDPEELRLIDERLGHYHSLAKKYRCEPNQLANIRKSLLAELGELEASNESLETLQQRVDKLEHKWRIQAQRLTVSRTDAAQSMSTAVSEQMHQLALPHGEFNVRLKPNDNPAPTASGAESIEFLIRINPGSSLQPLAQVASGGELSRLSLAIQVVAAAFNQVPTLIFDEVDVGIGGSTAEIVGNLLRTLAANRQVLCVTHLPQVASQAHQHLRVEKISSEGTTRTHLTSLDAPQRVREIARMLGGVEITQRTLEHAEEMVTRVLVK